MVAIVLNSCAKGIKEARKAAETTSKKLQLGEYVNKLDQPVDKLCEKNNWGTVFANYIGQNKNYETYGYKWNWIKSSQFK